MAFENYADKIRRYFPFSAAETGQLIIVIIAFGFFWSFTRWGTAGFDLLQGLKNWAIATIASAIIVLAHHSAQRLLGIAWGYRIGHKAWMPGLLIGLAAVLLSNGSLVILAATAMSAQLLAAHRLGKPREGPNLRETGLIALSGPLAAIATAFVLSALFPTKFFTDLMSLAVWFGLVNLIPIPPLDGLLVLLGARVTRRGSFAYFFILGAFFGFLLVYYTTGIGFFLSSIIACITGFFTWLIIDAATK